MPVHGQAGNPTEPATPGKTKPDKEPVEEPAANQQTRQKPKKTPGNTENQATAPSWPKDLR